MMMMMQAAPVRAVPAVASDVPLDVSAVGNVEAIASVDVKSRVAGQVLRVDFQEGQNVEKGQLLFEIDPEPLQEQIAQIQADLVKDAALEQQARANVVKDEAHVEADQGGRGSRSGTVKGRNLFQGTDRASSGHCRFESGIARCG